MGWKDDPIDVPVRAAGAALARTPWSSDPIDNEPKDPGVLRSIGSQLLAGVFKDGSDELGGAMGAYAPGLRQEPGVGMRQPDGSVRYMATSGDVYRGGRDAEREVLRGADKHHPKLSFAAHLAGDVASDVAARVFGLPVGSRAYSTAVGALSGLLRSDADLTPDKITPGNVLRAGASTAAGAGFGLGGHLLGEKVIGPGVKWLGGKIAPGLASLSKKAGEKVADAEERAATMGAEMAATETAAARATAGGESTHAANIAKTLLQVDTPDMPRSAGAYAEFLENASAKAAKKAEELAQRGRATHGVEDALRGDPEFAAKAGSALAKGQRAADSAGFWEKAASDLAEQAAHVRKTGIAPEGAFEAARARALASPEFAELRGNVLENHLMDLPGEAARSKAAREAARVASEGEAARGAQHAADLLSGRAAKNAVMDRLKRYGPPLAGSMAGAAFGGPVGAGVGAVTGMVAGRGMEALAGAGMRPAVRSFINMVTKYPAVSSRAWGAVQRAAHVDPGALGQFAPMLLGAGARGQTMEGVHEALLAKVPAYAERVLELTQGDENEGTEEEKRRALIEALGSRR